MATIAERLSSDATSVRWADLPPQPDLAQTVARRAPTVKPPRQLFLALAQACTNLPTEELSIPAVAPRIP